MASSRGNQSRNLRWPIRSLLLGDACKQGGKQSRNFAPSFLPARRLDCGTEIRYGGFQPCYAEQGLKAEFERGRRDGELRIFAKPCHEAFWRAASFGRAATGIADDCRIGGSGRASSRRPKFRGPSETGLNNSKLPNEPGIARANEPENPGQGTPVLRLSTAQHARSPARPDVSSTRTVVPDQPTR
jgi:hypothetical protein